MSSAGEAPPLPAPASQWTEHRNAQGRVYWYHQVEKKSVWEKPQELKSAREKALDSTPWKEYQSGERKYYVHSVTKQSSWTLPKELQDLFDSIPDARSPQSVPVAQGSQSPVTASTSQQRPPLPGSSSGFASSPHNLTLGSDSPVPGSATPNALPAAELPPVAPRPISGISSSNVSIAGGEEAFIQLLRDRGVDEKWTWEQTMREIITDPLYKALKTLAERKAAFSKYMRALEEQSLNARREKAKVIEPSARKAIEKGIAGGSRIESWLSYEGMLLRCPDGSAWRKLEAVGQEEARKLWTTITGEMRERESGKKRVMHKENRVALMALLRSFEADVQTRWKDARQTIFESEEWQMEGNLRQMDTVEMLDVFDELMRTLEKEREQELKQQAKELRRGERKRRDWFREKMQEAKRDGWLTVRTRFGDVYNRLQGDDELKAMLGQSGSSPLDLFHDVLDELEIELDDRMRAVEDLLGKGRAVTTGTSLEDFRQAVETALASSEASDKSNYLRSAKEEDLSLVFEELLHRAKEDARRAERKLRHLDEDLRYALKKTAHHRPEMFGNEATLDEDWEAWKPRIAALRIREWEEYERTPFALDDARIDEARKAAWERFVKRQKEKLAEAKERIAEVMTTKESRKRRVYDEFDGDGGPSQTDGDVSRKSEADKQREISRRERRAGVLDDPGMVTKRARKSTEAGPTGTQPTGGEDSEKEEGEV